MTVNNMKAKEHLKLRSTLLLNSKLTFGMKMPYCVPCTARNNLKVYAH